MNTGNSYSRHLHLTCVTAAALVSALWLEPALAAQSAENPVDAESVAHDNWRAFMTRNAAPAAGCFHASYPSYAWEKVDCKIPHPRFHPVHRKPTNGAEVTGNRDDYVAQAAGLIIATVGTFPQVTGVKSETGVGTVQYGLQSGILGANEYSLQINSNLNSTTTACSGHSGCTVWQQFVYAPDYHTKGEAAVFMQYWLVGWGSSSCPTNWGSDGEGDCYANSPSVSAPDLPITDLGQVTFLGVAVAGGYDTVALIYGGDAYGVNVPDSVLDISSVWTQSEFNVLGDSGGSRADFNLGSSITVNVALTDGSTSAPTCVAGAGTTGETNNLNLGICRASGGSTPSIQFTESN